MKLIALVIATLWSCWLLMMLVHESGHVIGAMITGGHVQRVIWGAFELSRTDVSPNPKPLIEVSFGPIVGCVVPILIALITTVARSSIAFLFWTFAGFCLIANGAYLGVGALAPVGDAKQLLTMGVSPASLFVGGWCSVIAGLFIWHRISANFATARKKQTISVAVVAVLLTILAAMV